MNDNAKARRHESNEVGETETFTGVNGGSAYPVFTKLMLNGECCAIARVCKATLPLATCDG